MLWCYLITCMARREVLNLAFVAIHHVMKDTRHRLRGFNPCRQTDIHPSMCWLPGVHDLILPIPRAHTITSRYPRLVCYR